jgi:hypothetical protein
MLIAGSVMTINGDVIHIEPLGNSPYEKYLITFFIRTIISSAPAYREKTVCILTIPQGYPKDRPKIAVHTSSMPPPWQQERLFLCPDKNFVKCFY